MQHLLQIMIRMAFVTAGFTSSRIRAMALIIVVAAIGIIRVTRTVVIASLMLRSLLIIIVDIILITSNTLVIVLSRSACGQHCHDASHAP